MTRINTNVSSLVAQKTLARSNTQLQEALTRLSTGLRINVGKDDPAGLIASESLRSDIISVDKAITNSQRANQLIATADSALGQVSQLLNDIRGLVSEAANTGALSEEQISANQLQLDSSLEAIDRIAQITSFQGRRLLDGNLDFITSGVDSSAIGGLQIDQANFGTQKSIGVQVNVVKQATRGKLNYSFGAVSSNVVLEIGGANGTEAFNFAAGSTIEEIASAVNLVSDATGVQAVLEKAATKGTIDVSSFGANNDVVLTAKNAGKDAGDIRVKYSLGGTSGTSVNYTAASGGNPATIDVQLQTSESKGAQGLRIDDDNLSQTKAKYTIDFNDAFGAGADVTVTAANAGAAYHGVTFNFVNDASLASTPNAPVATFDAQNKTVTVRLVSGTTTAANVKTAIDNLAEFSATGGDAVAVGAQGNTVTQTQQGIGDSKNALDITANISGTDFNGTDVRIVSGNGTQAGITTNLVQRSAKFYGTASGTSTPANNGFEIKVKSDSTRFLGARGGDINIAFTDTNATANGVNDISFNENTNTLTIAADFSGNLTAGALVTALNSNSYQFDDFGDGSLNISDVFQASNFGGDGTGSSNVGTAVVSNQNNTVLGSNTATQASRSFTLAGASETLTIAARAGSSFAGAAGNKIFLNFTDSGAGGGVDFVTFNENTGELRVHGDLTNGYSTAALISAVNGAVTNQGNALKDILNVTTTGADTVAAGDITNGLISAGTAGTGDAAAVAGEGYNTVQLDYKHTAQKAFVAINSSAVSGLGDDSAFIIRAAQGGSQYNDVAIEFVDGGANSLDVSFTPASGSNSAKLTITLDADTNTVAQVIAKINEQGTFTAELDDSVDTDNNTAGGGGGYVITSANVTALNNASFSTENTGGDAGTLFVYIEDGVTTAQDVINALSAQGNERANALFSISNSQDSDGSGLLFKNTKVDALSGGQKGGQVVATGQDVVDAINGSGAAAIVDAALATNNSGVTAVTAFQEFAFFGAAEANNRLQFLAPKNAPNIRFISKAGSALGLDLTTDPQVKARSKGVLAAKNANASLVFSAINQGPDFDDVAVRFKAGVAGANNTVTFDRRESAAQTTINFAGDAGNNADLRLTANTRGSDFNDVTVVLDNDTTNVSGNDAIVSYDATAKTLTVKYNATNTTAAKVLEKINEEGTFSAELDYGDNDAATGTYTLAAGDETTSAATFSGGGHKGGVLEFTIQNGTTTAQDVINTLSSDDYVSAFFQATTFGPSGTGLIDVDNDSGKAVTDGGLASSGTLIINLQTDANGLIKTTANDLIKFFDSAANKTALEPYGISVTNASGSNGTGLLSATTGDIAFATSGTKLVDANASGEVTAVNGVNARFKITAINKGDAYNNVKIVYENSLAASGNETAAYNSATKTLTVQVKAGVNASTAAQVVSAINNITTQSSTSTFDKFTAVLTGDGSAAIDLNDTGTLTGGVVDAGSEDGAAFLGNADLADAGLTFKATRFGSDSFVQVKALSGSFQLTNEDGNVADRATGTDVDVRINGIQAIGRGLRASINTSSLDLAFSLSEGVTDNQQLNFSIVGGGAQFQLGPDVVSNQQARLGIQSVSTATLGGVNGRLFELRSGGSKALNRDAGGAAKVVEDVISAVTQLRGRLGAFQKTTLDTNIATLNDTLSNLTDAESSIRDADFAAESARLTRAQILVQSGTSVLSIANSNPQNVLALLR